MRVARMRSRAALDEVLKKMRAKPDDFMKAWGKAQRANYYLKNASGTDPKMVAKMERAKRAGFATVQEHEAHTQRRDRRARGGGAPREGRGRSPEARSARTAGKLGPSAKA